MSPARRRCWRERLSASGSLSRPRAMPAPGRLAEAGAWRAAIGIVRSEPAEASRTAPAGSALSSAGERLIQRPLVDRLRQQLGDVAAHVVGDLPRPHRLAVEGRGIVEQGLRIVVDDRLEGDAKLLAVAQDGLVVLRQACRAGVEVERRRRGPSPRLRAVALLDPVAAAQRPAAASRPRAGLEHDAIKTGLGQLVGGCHAGDAGAQDDDAPPAPGTRRQGGRPRVGRRRGQQAHRHHRAVDRPNPTRAASEIDEGAARQAWL